MSYRRGTFLDPTHRPLWKNEGYPVVGELCRLTGRKGLWRVVRFDDWNYRVVHVSGGESRLVPQGHIKPPSPLEMLADAADDE